ncbi:PilZ domain-containing protein [Aurantiacibacter sediminis]|uniref:PilZ domain-containing protein n=1 Tax=Aurantiacibacter sediminis TaxID=2793064 RepID=A0ABS0N5U5_9SPHN|nr:PilZ domain-containing protein [Aurantiacibacter sediminis]MBH5323142.1 PilZ domain-containing protein [Aurantiacibacter sediminis]
MLAGSEQSRLETRHTAMLQAKMRDERSTRPVRVGDISPRGMKVVTDRPPARGSFVDILVSGHQVAGQVRWVNGRQFGIRTHDRIDMKAILSGKSPNTRIKGKRIEPDNDPDKWPLGKLVAAYSLLGVTAFSSAYLLVTYFVL